MRPNCIFPADENALIPRTQELQTLDCPGYDFAGRMVATHRINGDTHRGRVLLLFGLYSQSHFRIDISAVFTGRMRQLCSAATRAGHEADGLQRVVRAPRSLCGLGLTSCWNHLTPE